MTAYSQNGWPANDRSVIASYTVPGTNTRIAMRMGDVSVVLLDFLGWFNTHIEPLDGGTLDDWGYAERPIRGGTALSNHCLTGDTEVITYDGLIPIGDLAGTSARLLTRNPSSGRSTGRWVEAPVRAFGAAPTFFVTLTRGSLVRQIRTTAEHRWFVERGSSTYQGNYTSKYAVVTEERTTVDLTSGDKLAMCLPPTFGLARLSPSSFGIIHGLVYGDGTIQPSQTHAGDTCKITLWGSKTELLDRFPPCPMSPCERDSGITGIELRGLPNTYKRLPSLDESSTYLAGWLAGYFAADGCVQPSEITMSSRDRDALVHVRAVAGRLGIATRQPRVTKSSGGYKPGDNWSISFVRATVPDWMILRARHREKLSDARRTVQRGWTVRDVVPTGDVEPVYCATVEGTGAFALDDWILTGNSSGTAVDMNATRHPLGKVGTFTPDQQRRMNEHLARYDGVLRLGMNYTGRKDDMHAEINAGSAAVAAVANKIRAGQLTPVPEQEEDEDMARIMRAAGKMDALQDGPLFLGLNAEESKNLQASGLKVVWINSSTWDALARAQAVGQPYGHNIDGDPAKA